MRLSTAVYSHQLEEGEKRCLNSELWHACAGPLVSLPTIGNRVVYFPQGHSEQVAASTNKDVDSQIPNCPTLPPHLICMLHNVTMHADVETDELYAQMTLQPLNQQEQKDPYLSSDLGISSKQPTNYFCKALTASDTSTHGGFSVPRRAAEKVFPPLDFSQQPPAQELIARDLHDNEWKFRHIFRGQPKRHLLTTGWSVFVSAKRLVAGDSVIFIWNEKNQLLLGIRRASRPQTVMPSSVLSSDSMHLGLLAAASHAAATNSRFTIFYNPRASPSEFVIPLAKYVKAVYHTWVSVGMRFRMMFETEESSVRRYMGTITGISDLDSARWPNSHWRSVKVGWDESTAGERQPRVSLWEIEPLTTFPMYPSPFPLRLKRPWPSGLSSLNGFSINSMGINNPLMWDRSAQSLNFSGAIPWMNNQIDPNMFGLQPDMYQTMASVAALQEIRAIDSSKSSNVQQLTFPHGFDENQTHPFANKTNNNNTPFDEQSMQTMLPLGHQQSFSDSTQIVSPLQGLLGSFPQDDSSHMFCLPRTTPVISSMGHVGLNQNPVLLPPFPGRDCSIDQEGNIEHQSNLLFGVNIEPSSLLMHNGISSLKGEDDTINIPFESSNFMSAADTDFSINPKMMDSNCVDDLGFTRSLEKSGQLNPPTRSFVKVYKMGTFGRSLDITKFSSYQELRSELSRMFGLERQLEDPMRSGWQLVFVDRENDVLLVGDGPWPDFVNSVWCIKILSPEEVQEMGKRGLELLKSVPNQNLS